MLVLDDGCFPYIYPEGVTQPAEPLLDIIWQLSRLIKQYTSPNSQGMSRVPLEFVRSSVRAYLFDGFSEELGNFVTSEVNYLALFCLIYRNGQVIRLIQSPCP
jgi:hypothetical protein